MVGYLLVHSEKYQTIGSLCPNWQKLTFLDLAKGQVCGGHMALKAQGSKEVTKPSIPETC